MKTKTIILLLLIAAIPGRFALQAQTTPISNSAVSGPVTCPVTIGFELDALPFITGGYYGSVWVGHNRFRYRAIVTRLNAPDFYVASGFTRNKINAYTLIADYFFKPHFEKWWVGAGIEYWDCSIQADTKIQTATYQNTIFTLGGGYVWKFYRNFYLNPWVGGHLRLAGDQNVAVDAKTYKPALLSPEASVKLGWHF